MCGKNSIEFNNSEIVNENFKTIRELDYKKYSTLVGVIKSVLEPIKTKGTDYVTTLTVCDEEKDLIDIKIFTKTPRFANTFSELDIVRIPSVKLHKPGVGLTGLGSQIEVIAKLHDEDNKVFVTESEKNKINKLRNSMKNCNLQSETKFPRLKIQNITSNMNFSFTGLLINIESETPTLTVLTMIDYTECSVINPVVPNGIYKNNMTLIIQVWGETNANSVKNLIIDRIYHISHLKTGILNLVLQARISEYFYKPFIEVNAMDKICQEIFEAQKKYFTKTDSHQTISNFVPEAFKSHTPTQISKMNKNGIYRIKANVIFNFPFEPVEVFICDNCRSLESKELKLKKLILCKNVEGCNKYTEKIINVKLEDFSGSCFVLFKNELAEKFGKNATFLRHKELDCLVLRNKIFNFLIDSNFNYV